MSDRDIVRITPPEALRSQRLTGFATSGICRALAVLSADAPTWFDGLLWGPTGAVGYQLATGTSVLHEGSDLDIIVRAPQYLTPTEAQSILHRLARLPCSVDCLVETAAGAVALSEWAASAGRSVLLRTADGPRLTRDPWGTESSGQDEL